MKRKLKPFKSKYKNKKQSRNKLLILTAFLLTAVILTVSVGLQRQNLLQHAQTQKGLTSPPLYGCLHVGEADQANCGTKMGIADWIDGLKLYGRPIQDKQMVYYGDRLSGSLKFTNTGDLPIQLEDMGIVATSDKTKDTRDFKPTSGHTDLDPQKSISVNNASYKFDSPDPNGTWEISTKITNTDKQSVNGGTEKKTIVVNATCTALRSQELTDTDKSNLKQLCSKTPDSKLCTSREYCEIFKGSGCSAKNVSDETPGWTCSSNVYLPKTEQDLLEELCKTYPDTDACKDFCKRSINSPLCPQKYLFIDTRTGKPIPHLVNPRAVFVRDSNGFQFTYAKAYPPKGKKLPGVPTATAYLKTKNTIADQNIPQAVAAKATDGAQLFLTFLFDGISVPGTENAKLACGFIGLFCSTPAGGTQILPKMGFFGGWCSGICGPAPAAPGAAAPAPAAAPAAPAQCGIGGNTPPCAPEKNTLPPDPKAGRMIDPATCNPDGSAKTPGIKCTSLTDPTTAQPGDFGYAPQCSSKRQDMNPSDDPAGVDQATCCANSLTLREGCCGQQCTVWSQNTQDGTWRDGANHVCTNNPAQAGVDNTCNIYGGPGQTGPQRILPGGGPAVNPQPACPVGSTDPACNNTGPGANPAGGSQNQTAPANPAPGAPGDENGPCAQNFNGFEYCNNGLTCTNGTCVKPAQSNPSACLSTGANCNPDGANTCCNHVCVRGTVDTTKGSCQ